MAEWRIQRVRGVHGTEPPVGSFNRVQIVRQRRGSRRLWLVAFAAALASFAMPHAPALANPDDTRVLAYRLPCGAAMCDDETYRLSPDDITAGNVQIQAKTSSAIGLTSVEVQLQLDGEWRCLTRWATSARSGTWQRNVDLGGSVNDCSGDPLTDGSNGLYRVRSVATDRGGSQASASLTVKVSSPPVAPTWAAAPERTVDSDDAPSVELRWYANPEPDIVEYHFIRDDGDRIVEYAISANHPGGQGCSKTGGIYECTDDAFPANGYSGNYRYSLAAFRASPDERGSCSLPGAGACVRSANSSPHTLSLRQPPPPPADPNRPPDRPDRSGPGRDSGSSTGSRPPDGPSAPRGPTLSEIAAGDYGFESGDYSLELPYEVAPTFEGTFTADTEELAFSPQAAGDLNDEERQRQGMVALAGGFLALILATHLVRVLRAPAR